MFLKYSKERHVTERDSVTTPSQTLSSVSDSVSQLLRCFRVEVHRQESDSQPEIVVE